MPYPRKPTLRLLAEGTWRPDRHAGRLAEPQSGPLGDCPRDLPTGAREVWRELVPALPWLQRSDRVALWVTCRLIADDRAGVLEEGKRRILYRMFDQMGMTPASRARLQPEPKPRGRPPGRGKAKGLAAYINPTDD